MTNLRIWKTLLNLEVVIKSSVISVKKIHRRKWLLLVIVTLKGVKRSIVKNTKRLELSYHNTAFVINCHVNCIFRDTMSICIYIFVFLSYVLIFAVNAQGIRSITGLLQ